MEHNEIFLEQLSDMEKYFDYQEKVGNILRKSAEISEEARKAGNDLYSALKGNDKQVYQNILLHYTKSIAFAPKDSEKLVLGYSNRSALLMRMRYYEESINDIDKVLEITKSENMKSKLEERKAKCEAKRLTFIEKSKVKQDSLQEAMKKLKLTDKEIANTVFELPKVIKSPKPLVMSKLVNIEHNKTYGRHFIANKDIKPGEIIIAERLYAGYPELNQIYLVCSHCLSLAWNGIPCDFCVYSIYCSEACKQAAWQEYHDVECHILPYLYCDKSIYQVSTNLLARMFIKAVKAETLKGVMSEAQNIDKQNDNGINTFLSDMSLDEQKFGTCYNLQSIPSKKNVYEDRFLREGVIVNLLIKHTNIIYEKEKPDITKLSDEKIFALRDILTKIENIINLNQFCFQFGCTCPMIMNECENDCDVSRGNFIAPYCSLVNHSCIPNTGMLCLPEQKIVLFAIQPIKKNEQIFYTYGPILDGEIGDRRHFLLHHYYFTCQCMACKQNWQFHFNSTLSKSDMAIYGNLLLEFQKMLHTAEDYSRNQFLHELPNQWQLIDKASLYQTLKLSELTYTLFKNQPAFNCSVRYRRYIRKALYLLYGEKNIIASR